MAKFTHLSSLVFNKPLLVTQDYAETIAVVLSDKLDLDVTDMSIKNEARDGRPVHTTSKGVRVIPIVGSMSHRPMGLEAMSGMTSYASLQAQFEEAFNDPNVGSILMDIDSPGGSVAGAFDFRDYLMANKGRKPVYALARDAMCSAAYLIGSTADKVYATQTARVGSIGVVAMHVDRSEKNKAEGIKPTFISAGEFKTAGNPHEPLEGKHLKYLQDSVDESYKMFIDAVVEARGMEAKDVRATEARVYGGKKAVEIGLADGIRTYESVLREMSAPDFNINYNKGMKMSTETIDVAKLATDLAETTAKVEKLTADNETLRKQVLEAGFKITAEGLVAKEAPEMIEVAGEKIDASTLPKAVVDALKDKADADLTAKATAEYPNLRPDVAKKLYATFGNDAEMSEAIKGFNSQMGELLEEKGDTQPGGEQLTAKEKFEKAVKDEQAASGMNYHDAYAKVAKTDEGKQLIQEIYKDKE